MTAPLSVSLRADLEKHIGPIQRVTPVTGGCVSRALKVEAKLARVFLKVDDDVPEDFFAAEVEGLENLAESGTAITFPRVVARGTAESTRWLALEWLDGVPSHPHWEQLGRELARLHRRTSDAWGWHRNGYIGKLPQSNRPSSDWADFWQRERLDPQIELATSAGLLDDIGEWEELRCLSPDILSVAGREGPSLLHGDLWSGNVMALANGPALVDPACYFGHREVDLAMAALFGGFQRRFFAAYDSEWPLAHGYAVRRKVYQLYYLLVHVNLFGRGYIPSTLATLGQVLGR